VTVFLNTDMTFILSPCDGRARERIIFNFGRRMENQKHKSERPFISILPTVETKGISSAGRWYCGAVATQAGHICVSES
jgi:hypothetical protein